MGNKVTFNEKFHGNQSNVLYETELTFVSTIEEDGHART